MVVNINILQTVDDGSTLQTAFYVIIFQKLLC